MDNKSFEEIYARYKEISKELEDENLDFQKAIDLYKESKIYYGQLKEIIDKAKLEIVNLKDM